jgi:hypothetical protein
MVKLRLLLAGLLLLCATSDANHRSDACRAATAPSHATPMLPVLPAWCSATQEKFTDIHTLNELFVVVEDIAIVNVEDFLADNIVVLVHSRSRSHAF